MKALILVDIQNDFLPTGALPVKAGDEVIPVVNRVMPQFTEIVATQDWHPANHGSFAVNHAGKKPGDLIDLDCLQQILWPAHCVQDTPGAAFAPGLDASRLTHVVRKGANPQIDSYSGFFDNGHRQATGLDDYLRSKNVRELYIVGLATDYCVKFTVLDARQLGYDTTLIVDGCRGVNLRPEDVAKAIAEMRNAGVKVIQSGELGFARQ